MLTRCPHCQTHFRVTAEQLKIRQGTVRCGACQEVFDALETLHDESLAALPLPSSESAESQSRQDGDASDARGARSMFVQVATIPAAANEAAEVQPQTEVEPEPELQSEPALVSEPGTEAETELVLEFPGPQEPQMEADFQLAEPEPEPEPEPATTVTTTPDAEPEPESVEPASALVKPEASADSAAKPAAEDWETVPAAPAVPKRWPWVIGILALLIVGAGQLSYIFRTELAVVAPELRPALVAGCELIGCTLPRPLKPELVGIETSDLAPEGKGLLLTATLKNRAPFAQDYPHLELTLTDTQDEALARKVLTPADYLPAGQDPATGFAARGEVAVRLSLTAEQVPAVGYRLYLFYP